MTPAGGRAVRRALTGRFVLCTLLRSDDSRFARLHIDADQHVLGVAFYRPSGAPLSAVDSSYAATSPSPANVKCGSSAQATLGKVYWKKTRKWWIGATPGGMNRDAVVNAVRNAQSEWTNDINWCGIKDQANRPRPIGKDVDDVLRRTAERRQGEPRTTRTAMGRSHSHVVRREGHPGRADIRFNTAYKWSTTGAAGALTSSRSRRTRLVTLQFDHVTNASKDDETNVCGRISRTVIRPGASSAAATRSRTIVITEAAEDHALMTTRRIASSTVAAGDG
jgi:hypothetical protein